MGRLWIQINEWTRAVKDLQKATEKMQITDSFHDLSLEKQTHLHEQEKQRVSKLFFIFYL